MHSNLIERQQVLMHNAKKESKKQQENIGNER